MAKYASQPSLPSSPAFGAQPNNFSTMGAFRPGQPLPSGPGAGANPYQAPGAAQGAPATAQGIMQTAQGQGLGPQPQPGQGMGMPPAPQGMPQPAAPMGKVAGEAIVSTISRLMRPTTARGTGHQKTAAASVREISDVISRLAAPSILPAGNKDSAPVLVKSAGMPMGPATAMPPAAPPPMPTQLGVQGMLPPGAAPPGGPGAAPPPGDPSMGGAPQDPAAAGGAPPPGGMPPGGDPSMGGAAPPPTLNGEVPPLGMPPTPPLPANPRVNPPRQATPEDFQRRQDLNSLLAMDEQVQPDTMAEEIQPDLLASGSKSAFDFVERLARPELRAKIASIAPQAENVFDRFRDVFAQIWNEKQAAQDNGPDQHTLQRSCTGESKGLTYQNKPDHYAQGQDAWASVSGYFKGGAKKKPNPFIGKHASCGDELAFKRYKALGYSDEEADRLAGQPLDKQAGVDFGKHDTSFSRMRKLQNRRQPLPEQKNDIGSFSTTFKYAMDKEAAMPPMGKSNAPVIKPGFSLKSAPPAAPYSPGAGVLKGKQDVLKPLKMPTVPASVGAGNRPKLAMDDFKALGLTDFAAAFFARCQIHDVDAGTVKIAMDRVATDYGEVAHAELLDGFTKLAADWGGFAQKALGMVQKAMGMGQKVYQPMARAANVGREIMRPATSAVKQTMQQPNFGSHLRTNVTRTAMGGVMGGLTGRQDTGSSVGVPGTEASMGWDWRNAAAGAAAFNPWLNKVNKGGGSMASPLIQGFRGKTMGQFAGQAGDLMGQSLGFDTGGAGSEWGSTLGAGLGVARGGAMALGKLPQMQRFAPQINRAGQAAAQVLSPAARFGEATDDLLAGAVTYPFRAGAAGARRMAMPGRFADKAMDWMGFAPAHNNWTPLFTNKLKPGNLAGYMGRTAGGVATGVGGAVFANDLFNNKVDDRIVSGTQQAYNNIRPQMARDVTNVADAYLNDLGVLSPEGKMQLPMPGGSMGHQVMQMGDQIFRSVGMNPDTMSPAQKISILGGMGLLGGGAMMGSAPAAGLGALAAGGGMMAGGEQSPLMQLLHRLPRNEYTAQMQQTGQQAPNANPYGPTL